MARTSRKGGATAIQAVPAEKTWQTALYARLSVEDSGRKGADTIETQIELIHSYISSRDYLDIYDTYIDNGESGADFERPAWNRMMDDIRSGKVNCIAVKDLSRFGRNYIETCEMLEKIFPFMGVRFISINDGYDSGKDGSYSDTLIISLKNLINDWHLKDISRKISSSKKVRRERGEYTGAFAPFGYRKMKSDKHRLEPDEMTAPTVRDIFRWRSEGMSQNAICKRLDEQGVPCPSQYLKERYNVQGDGYYKAKVWRPKAIRNMIRSRTYLGHLEQGKTQQALYAHKPLTIIPKSEWHVSENTHEAIISIELWEAANVVEDARHKEFFEDRKFTEPPDNLFRSFLVCGVCGYKLSRRHSARVNPSGKRYEYYHYLCSLKHQHPQDKQYPMVQFKDIYDSVFPQVANRLKLVSNMGAIIEKRAKSRQNPRAALDAEITASSRELEKKNEQLVKLYDNYALKIINERDYLQLKSRYEREAQSLRERLDDLARRASLMADTFDADNQWLKASQDFISPKILTREMLEALVEKIEITHAGDIHMVWKFDDDYTLLESCSKEVSVHE